MRKSYSLTAPLSPAINQYTVSLKFKPHPILEPPCVTVVRNHIHNSMVGSRINLTISSYQEFCMIRVVQSVYHTNDNFSYESEMLSSRMSTS